LDKDLMESSALSCQGNNLTEELQKKKLYLLQLVEKQDFQGGNYPENPQKKAKKSRDHQQKS
jgi:hypothetical protein